jgi:putative tricarboxylic transport membrane protein
MRTLDYPIVPLVLGYILTPMVESEFRRGLMLVGNSVWAFFARPLFDGLLIIGVVAFWSATALLLRLQRQLALERD